LIQEKKLREEKKRAADMRKDLIQKRARYGELVKEMFAPSIDKAK